METPAQDADRFPTEKQLDWLRKCCAASGRVPWDEELGDSSSVYDVAFLATCYKSSRRDLARSASDEETIQEAKLLNDELVTALDAQALLEGARYYMHKMGQDTDVLNTVVRRVRAEVERLVADLQTAQADRENAIHEAEARGRAEWERREAMEGRIPLTP